MIFLSTLYSITVHQKNIPKYKILILNINKRINIISQKLKLIKLKVSTLQATHIEYSIETQVDVSNRTPGQQAKDFGIQCHICILTHHNLLILIPFFLHISGLPHNGYGGYDQEAYSIYNYFII